jgi:xanthine dehydrogenase accessory factor
MSLLLPKRRSLLADDDVMGDFILWQAAGQRTALISLVAIDGTTPRPLGALMAVAENGAFTGYMSGGCIEQSIAKDAVQAIAEGRNRMVRYGKGSAYFDLQLPCGSGLDFYIDQSLPPDM